MLWSQLLSVFFMYILDLFKKKRWKNFGTCWSIACNFWSILCKSWIFNVIASGKIRWKACRCTQKFFKIRVFGLHTWPSIIGEIVKGGGTQGQNCIFWMKFLIWCLFFEVFDFEKPPLTGCTRFLGSVFDLLSKVRYEVWIYPSLQRCVFKLSVF